MMIAGEAQGVIGVRFTRQRAFRAEELELAQALANQAMLEIRLARLSVQARNSAIIRERDRMARDIHDTLAQGFTGLIMHVEAAEEAMSRQRLDVVSGHLHSAGEIARDGLREARRSVHALRPLALEEKKLAEALREIVEKSTLGASVQGRFFSHGIEQKLPPECELNILRISQEALTNVLRHAKASTVTVSLIYGGGEILLMIIDDGCGFDASARHAGFGLKGMSERAQLLAAQFSLESHPGRGTTISLALKPAPPPETEAV